MDLRKECPVCYTKISWRHFFLVLADGKIGHCSHCDTPLEWPVQFDSGVVVRLGLILPIPILAAETPIQRFFVLSMIFLIIATVLISKWVKKIEVVEPEPDERPWWERGSD